MVVFRCPHVAWHSGNSKPRLTGVNPEMRSWEKHLPEWAWSLKAIDGIYFTKNGRAETIQRGLEFDNFEPRLENGILKCISWLNRTFHFFFFFFFMWWASFFENNRINTVQISVFIFPHDDMQVQHHKDDQGTRERTDEKGAKTKDVGVKEARTRALPRRSRAPYRRATPMKWNRCRLLDLQLSSAFVSIVDGVDQVQPSHSDTWVGNWATTCARTKAKSCGTCLSCHIQSW